MKKSRAITGILLLAAILAAAVSSVNGGECILCKGSPSAQQDVLSNEYAAFFGEGNATTEVYTTTGGLISPQRSRQDNPSLQAKSESASSTDSKSNADGKSIEASASAKARDEVFSSLLVPLDNVSDYSIKLDISPGPAEYIPGAIAIPYTDFLLSGGQLKTVSEIAKILADAGVSQNDSVLIYGECQPCGGGPSASTYVYWIMKYLGHEKVHLLDGGIDDWVALGMQTASHPSSLPATGYTPSIDADLLATYEYVSSGIPQIIDARSAAEYQAGSIPGSVNIPYDRVLDGKKIKGKEALQGLFSSFDKTRPVVVYTNTGVKASMVWLALDLLGYDARIYSWQDWQASLPHLNILLDSASGKPNPAKIGDVVQITATFKEKDDGSAKQSASQARNESANESVLTVKGCATCGFGSPQGFADLSSSGGAVQIGSSSQAKKSAANDSFSVSALILGPSGEQISKVLMTRIRPDGDEFSGFWNANVASGVYQVDIVAALGEITETFGNATQIEVSATGN
ncbi:MAG TPA: rhodanese-like domain-containing protein [Methanothrix sp.]|nr:rhodanese-like domain-containing protein [Methanothrix sp.]